MNLFLKCRDPDSGLIRNDLCLGITRRDCNEMMWTTIDFNPNITMLKKLTEGIPVWIKIKAVNNGTSEFHFNHSGRSFYLLFPNA